MKKITLVTSGQPSANPRLKKEAMALSAAGYLVTVIYCPLSPWADTYDKQLFEEWHAIQWVRVGYHPNQQPKAFLYARIRQNFYQICYKWLGNKGSLAIKAFVLFSQELEKAVRKYKADLYIGHNLGAIKAVVEAAKIHQSTAVFDFEDFHRGEAQEGSFQWNVSRDIEDKYAPQLRLATTASPLFTEAYKKLYPLLQVRTINNCFPLSYQSHALKSFEDTQTLNLFWFSQTIGKCRGLENVIVAIGLLGIPGIRLNLLGNCSTEMKNYLSDFADKHQVAASQLVFLHPVQEEDLVTIASGFDIGIASEIPACLSRDWCLTNKLFIYLLAGNAICCSNTSAQHQFVEQLATHAVGFVYDYQHPRELANHLKEYFQNRALLNQHKANALYWAKSVFNWELEQKKMQSYVADIVNSL